MGDGEFLLASDIHALFQPSAPPAKSVERLPLSAAPSAGDRGAVVDLTLSDDDEATTAASVVRTAPRAAPAASAAAVKAPVVEVIDLDDDDD